MPRSLSLSRLFSPMRLFPLPVSAASFLVVGVCVLGSRFDSVKVQAAPFEVQYSGSLTEVSRDGESPAPAKQFDLYNLLRDTESGDRCFYLVTERGAGSWPWPERFGEVILNESNRRTEGRPPHVLHEYDGAKYPVELPLPLFEFADRLAPDASWESGRQQYSVTGESKKADRDCWQVVARDNFGRRQKFDVEKNSGLLVAAERHVFVGRGDEFVLRMALSDARSLSPEQTGQMTSAIDALLSLQSDLERKEDNTKPQLSSEQIEIASKAVPELMEKAGRDPVKRLVVAMARDVRAQAQRAGDVSSLEEKFVGEELPGFVLPLLNGDQIDSASLEGQITVLHFWEYQSEQLEEPYGQVGYLDFLMNQRGHLGVHVIGVAVNEAFNKADEFPAAKRSVAKLRDFMNISYPIALDSGKVLKSLGDPRRLDAGLPLWVVVGPDGKIAEYHVGLYSVNPNEGLRELDKVVVRLIREQRSEAKQ